MKRLFLDTNFIIDYFVRDDYRSVSEQLLVEGAKRGYEFCISFLSVANFAYILRKQPLEQRQSVIRQCCEVFTVVNNTSYQIDSALSLEAIDFEDALQYQSAVDAGCDCIITRNSKDFKFSKIPVCSAVEFMERYLG